MLFWDAFQAYIKDMRCIHANTFDDFLLTLDEYFMERNGKKTGKRTERGWKKSAGKETKYANFHSLNATVAVSIALFMCRRV